MRFFLLLIAVVMGTLPGSVRGSETLDGLYPAGSYALLIGVSSYRSRGWSPLPGVVRDLEAVEEELSRIGFEVTRLDDPTRDQLCDALATFLADYGGHTGARLLIYYAGHGTTLQVDASLRTSDMGCEQLQGQHFSGTRSDAQYRSGQREGFLVMTDSPHVRGSSADSSFIQTALRFGAFREAVESPKVNAQHVMVVFDSCFSGALFGKRSGIRIIYPGTRRPPAISHFFNGASRFYLTSGTDTQEVPDESIFRQFFLSGLNGKADLDGDGYVTGQELAMYVRDGVARQSNGRNLQTPMFANTDPAGRSATTADIVFRSPLGKRYGVDDLPEIEEKPTRRPDNLGIFRDECPQCPDMVVLQTGQFLMGASEDDTEKRASEVPQKEATIDSRIAMSRDPITNAQWNECFRAGFCDWAGSSDPALARHPVTNVSFKQVLVFNQWLSAVTGYDYRLPSEIEWEFAARSGSHMSRPWGFEPGLNNAHCRGCSNLMDLSRTAPIGSYPANEFGLHDMLGNVWEFTTSCWMPRPDPNAPIFDYRVPACTQIAIRGGSFATSARQVRASARSPYPIDGRFNNIGFRVVSEL